MNGKTVVRHLEDVVCDAKTIREAYVMTFVLPIHTSSSWLCKSLNSNDAHCKCMPAYRRDREREFIYQVRNIDNTHQLLQWQAASGGISPS